MAGNLKIREKSTILVVVFISILVLFWAGILSTNNKSANNESIDDFKRLCRKSARAKVINATLWKEYIELAKQNIVRTDKKISLIELNGFNFSFGPKRSPMARSFPHGLHDEEVFITYNQRVVAILFVKIKVIDRPDTITYYSCLDDGLDPFISN